jgi:hypothetical protein
MSRLTPHPEGWREGQVERWNGRTGEREGVDGHRLYPRLPFPFPRCPVPPFSPVSLSTFVSN